MPSRHHPRVLVVAIFVLCVWPGNVRAQETVQMAQSLYASAAYDEALAVLDRLQLRPTPPIDARAINQQRALCLLALGRGQEAELAIAAVVQSDPEYRPDESAVSPRVRAAFRDVRTRLLPGIVQNLYADARRQYDAKSWAEAAEGFQRTLTLAVDPDLNDTQAAALSDIRVLADGFVKLAEAAAAPPPPPPAPAPPAPETPAAPVIDYDRVYTPTEAGVDPPLTLRQDVPRWTSRAMAIPRGSGTLELIISKEGVVERATMTKSVVSFYDRQVLDATKNWRYRPAQFNGQPVRCRKTIGIAFQ